MIVTLNALVNFGIIFGLFVVFLIVTGNFPGLVFVTLLPVLVLQVLLALGIGMVVGILNVFFRDVGQFMTIALQFWFWLTPIVYPASILPEHVRPILDWNPMAPIIATWQGVLVKGTPPDWGSLVYPLVVALLLCTLGLRMFRKRAGEIVDEL